MNTRSLLRPAFAGAGVAAAAVLAFAMPAGASVSVQSSSPSIASLKLGAKATIQANGAVVFAPTKLKCPTGYSGYLDVHITEAVGNTIASGEQSIDVPCTGSTQSITVYVSPTQHPYKKGIAWGTAHLSVYGPNGQLSVDDAHTIQLVN